MKKRKKKSHGTPRRKKMNRTGRLPLARNWLLVYTGKNLVRGYAKHFGVDKLCAIWELRMLGIVIEETCENAVKASISAKALERKKRKEKLEVAANTVDDWSDAEYAFIAGYTSNGVPFGTRWEELEKQENEFVLHYEDYEDYEDYVDDVSYKENENKAQT